MSCVRAVGKHKAEVHISVLINLGVTQLKFQLADLYQIYVMPRMGMIQEIQRLNYSTA